MTPLYLPLRLESRSLHPHRIDRGLHHCDGRPGWLCGAQSVALNFSQNDLAVQLHFALFKGCGGFVLKPPEMRQTASAQDASMTSLGSSRSSLNEKSYSPDVSWPPPQEDLSRTTFDLLSLHCLPNVCRMAP